MPRAARFFIFLSLSLLCLIAAGVLLIGQMSRFNAAQGRLPPGTTIAGIPVGGLDAQEAAGRVAQVYALTPVELRIGEAVVHIDPPSAGQRLDLQAMLNSAAEAEIARPYWSRLWDFLWNRQPAGTENDLACSVDETQLRAYLEDLLAGRFDQPAQPARPAAPADVVFVAGQPGLALDLSSAEPQIRAALCSREQRVVELTTTRTEAPPPEVESLDLVLRSLVQVSAFDGIIEVYFQDLASGEEISFAYANGAPAEPNIAFTAASTIKIPVMVSAYRRIDGALPDSLRSQMELMIDLSENSSTDVVMQEALDPNTAPLQVTEDLRALGLENTFLAGFFYPGAPLLNIFQTPANSRTDLDTDPDIYNQTTAADMGRLLSAIHRCAGGSGPLIDTFSGQITQAECQEMTALLAKNRKGLLIEAGLPDGAPLAHKYGFVTDVTDGLMHTASDAAIVYTPGGDFVLTTYLYHRDQLHWDPAQRLVARLATAAYNFYTSWR